MSGPGRRPIRRLEPELVSRIAAGEVVERPASVVKELIENSVDAGARSVSVRLDGGGIERIVVSDDGRGIPAEELALAVERHATSKLPDEATLARVGTLGFRGEALAAIAAVSRLTLLSRVEGAEEAHGLRVEGTSSAPFLAGRGVGTTVTVEGLFENVPARKKFLRSPAAEQVEVTSTVDRLYLARPEVALALEANGESVARYPASPLLREAAGHVFGPEFAEAALRVERVGDVGRVDGWVGRPPLSRSSLGGLYLAVNGRTVLSRSLGQAVRLAYTDYLPRTRFPVGVLHLTLDPERVDVNVHPTKREVRIAREEEVAELLRHAVREALRAAPQEAAPAGSERSPSYPGPYGDDAAPGDEPVSAVFAPALLQRTLLPAEPLRSVAAGRRHPALTLLGSVAALYWVAASGEDFVLIDQHAASERVLYDELTRKGRLGRQELVEPVRLALSPRQAATLAAEASTVSASGFLVEPFGTGSWRVHAVPAYRGHRASVEELPRLLDELADGGRPTVPDGLRERVAASTACHAAIRGGDLIDAEELARTLESLYALEEAAYACPHGRPILYRLPRSRMDRWFGRSGA